MFAVSSSQDLQSELDRVRQDSTRMRSKLLVELHDELEREQELLSRLKEANNEVSRLRARHSNSGDDTFAAHAQLRGRDEPELGITSGTQPQPPPPPLDSPVPVTTVPSLEVTAPPSVALPELKKPASADPYTPPLSASDGIVGQADGDAPDVINNLREMPPPVPTPVVVPVPFIEHIPEVPYANGAPTVLLIICYNRPKYLERALDSALRYHPANAPELSDKFTVPIVISQDGFDAATAAVAQRYRAEFIKRHPDIPFVHIQHSQENLRGDTGYHKLARHFGWALKRVFDEGEQLDSRLAGVTHTIILEEDIEIAPDFYSYFSFARRLLDRDPTVLAASAWNDNGLASLSGDAAVVRRSDFFPGLGWMLSRDAWKELGPKWPGGYWDDWLREPEQRKGRAFLVPEVCRTRTFGEIGVSTGQFYSQYLSKIVLNNEPIPWATGGSTAVDAAVTSLTQGVYDAKFDSEVRASRRTTIGEVVKLQQQHAQGGGSGVWDAEVDLRVEYNRLEGGSASFLALAKRLGAMADIKATVPRTAYHGVVTLRIGGHRVFVSPPL